MGERLSKAAAAAEAAGLTFLPPDSDSLLDAVRDPWRDPIPALLDGLDSENPAVRSQAALLLRELPSPRGIPPLAEMVTQDPDDAVRAEAAETLGLISGGGQAIPALIAATADASDLVRLCAAEALGNIGRAEPGVVAALVHCLDDEDSFVRTYAVEALAHVGDPSVIPILHEKMPDNWPQVRVWFRYALSQLGEPFDFGDVQEVLRRGGFIARIQAAIVLRLSVTDETEARVIAALQRAFARERHPGVLEQLQRLLGELGIQATIPVLESP